jgi:hypothetical protein
MNELSGARRAHLARSALDGGRDRENGCRAGTGDLSGVACPDRESWASSRRFGITVGSASGVSWRYLPGMMPVPVSANGQDCRPRPAT